MAPKLTTKIVKRQKTSSGPPSSSATLSTHANPNADNLFLALPAEIVDLIVSQLLELYNNHRTWCYCIINLAVASRTLYARYRLLGAFTIAKRFEERDDLWFLEGAKKGEAGWKPFTIMHVGVETVDGEEDMLFSVLEHDPAANERRPTHDYFYILAHLSMDEPATMHHKFEERCKEDEVFADEVKKGERTLSWDKEVKGRLIRAFPKVLWKRFRCPDCVGRREVKYGTKKMEER